LAEWPIRRAVSSQSEFEARTALAPLFGTEIDEIRAREAGRPRSHPLNGALRGHTTLARSLPPSARRCPSNAASDGLIGVGVTLLV
jgi:hypothetical protein